MIILRKKTKFAHWIVGFVIGPSELHANGINIFRTKFNLIYFRKIYLRR